MCNACNCNTLPWMHVTKPYNCQAPAPSPGYLKEPYHLPGYTGHIPTVKTHRFGKTFGRLSVDVMEDPCVAQAPIPVLQHPGLRCALDSPCKDDDTVFKPRGCYNCGCGSEVYRSCEPLCASYAGHKPGFTFHSLGRNNEKATFGTKTYLDQCFYYNTFSRI